jgi:hypothetical protein
MGWKTDSESSYNWSKIIQLVIGGAGIEIQWLENKSVSIRRTRELSIPQAETFGKRIPLFKHFDGVQFRNLSLCTLPHPHAKSYQHGQRTIIRRGKLQENKEGCNPLSDMTVTLDRLQCHLFGLRGVVGLTRILSHMLTPAGLPVGWRWGWGLWKYLMFTRERRLLRGTLLPLGSLQGDWGKGKILFFTGF